MPGSAVLVPLPIADVVSLEHHLRPRPARAPAGARLRHVLAGRRAIITTLKRKPTYEIARAERILRASAARVVPRCPHFGVCGGCSLQHFDAAAQVAAKQRALEDALWHLARVKADLLLPPIHGPSWGYRHRARLSVRHVAKKGGVLVGFHEKKSSYVADMTSCQVLPPKVSALLPALRRLVGELSIRDRVPQIELAMGDPCDGAPACALVLRILAPLTPDDEGMLVAFADAHDIEFWLQSSGPESAVLLRGPSRLATRCPSSISCSPRRPISPRSIRRSTRCSCGGRCRCSIPKPGELIADFFCGLGNFTLPIARRGARAVGIEGNSALIRRATAIAARNGLSDRATFGVANLFVATPESVEALGPLDKVLIDPPREGAIALVKALPGDGTPTRIVYVSCAPATLARDAGVLVHEHGYALAAAGVVNMFPHTAHVESIALFQR
jgi:23S rRNA (uracil1939-C5)-methyltransferase